MRFAIIPGNGCVPVQKCNWYRWLQLELEKLGHTVVLTDMPDPHEAKEKVWIPYMERELKIDSQTVAIGHSSGAEAIMRYIETRSIAAAVLVSACHTDLGMASEAVSGYYAREWLWKEMSKHTPVIVQFGSTDDPFLPASEQRHVAKQTGAHYVEYKDRGHFMTKQFPDLLKFVTTQLPKMIAQHQQQQTAKSGGSGSGSGSAAAPPPAPTSAAAAPPPSTADSKSNDSKQSLPSTKL